MANLTLKSLDNWITQIEAYCRVQKVVSERKKSTLLAFDLEELNLYGGKARHKKISKGMVK